MKSFIQRLYESEIKSTELALAVEGISGDLQSMIEKLSNIKVKEIAELVKKMKFDGDIQAGEQLNQSLGEKIDRAIQSLTEIKSDIDNETVKISQGDMSGSADTDMNGGTADFEDDFGDEDIEEFDPDNEYDDTDDLDLSDVDFSEVERTEK